MSRCRRWTVALVLLALAGCDQSSPPRPLLRIAAAASLRGVVPPLIDAFAARSDHDVSVHYGASDDLSAMVEAGGGVDAVMFADDRSVDALAADGLIDAATRRAIASNAIVLVGPAEAAGEEVSFAAIGRLHRGTKIGMGDPDSVPAGRYARRYLEALGMWEEAEQRAVYAGDVAAVLALARRGDVRAAIVYATDALTAPELRVLDRASGSHAPEPRVVVAVLAGAPGADAARALFAFIESAEGQRILAQHGFGAAD